MLSDLYAPFGRRQMEVSKVYQYCLCNLLAALVLSAMPDLRVLVIIYNVLEQFLHVWCVYYIA
jgi:hypothetical protein